jgi:hypothetical protein
MADGQLSLNGIFESPQGQIPISLHAQVTASEMTGTMEIEGMGTVSLTARRGGAAGRSHAIKDGGNR